MIKKKQIIYLLALITLVVFPLSAWVIFSIFSEKNFADILLQGRPWYYQAIAGVFYGLFTGAGAKFLVQQPFMREAREYFSNIIGAMRLNVFDILFISFCAGFGEEILFRGALQPLMGLWPAAILFVLVHGYINPKNWRISIYGLYLILVSVGFGYLFKHLGIIAPAIAHLVVDVLLLWDLRNAAKSYKGINE